MRLILTKLAISALITGVVGLLATPGFAQTSNPLFPGTLAIYYGMPSKVNGSQSISAAVGVFSQYDNVVFGDALEFPQYIEGTAGQEPYYGCDQNSHFDHDNTVNIIRQLKKLGTEVYGYVSIGGERTARLCDRGGGLLVPTPLTMPEIKARVDAWAAMRVTGILLDEAEYGFGCSRQRQTEAIDYVHSRGLRAFINGYNPDDVFSNAVVPMMNPNGLGTHLGRNDRYLLEHFQVINGNYVEDWTRANLASKYSDRYGTLIATIATTGTAFDQSQFNYAWWTTLLYGFDFVGWGEQWFSADNTLPYRVRPNPGQMGSAYTSSVIHQPPLHKRTTTGGTVTVDSTTHLGSFAPR